MRLSELAAPDAVVDDVDITGLTADSREVAPGYLFAALKGARADGAAFIKDALARGAVAVLAGPDAKVDGARVVRDLDPRRRLAVMAARLFPRQPGLIAAVTGTNGKSSTVEFLRQMWSGAGFEAACLGTLGVRTKAERRPLSHTTPDPVAIHRTLDGLAGEGVTHAAMEASSHGLDQRRLDAVRVSAVAFTNLTQDHLDYHPDLEAYLAAKLRLFTELAPKGAPGVVNVDSEAGRRVAAEAAAAGVDVRTVGWSGAHLKIREIIPRSAGQTLDLLIAGKPALVELPLVGEFQALNAVSAAGLALATGVSRDSVLETLSRLAGVPGRLQMAGETEEGAPVFIDYAHTPDGLEKLLRALRNHTAGRLRLVFGCGGDRDAGKRPLMGAVAARLADDVLVTDDNPRGEDPAAIRAAIRQGAPGAREMGDRATAIEAMVDALARGDALVVAGKGHETGQIVGDRVIPFDDIEAARAALAARAKKRGAS